MKKLPTIIKDVLLYGQIKAGLPMIRFTRYFTKKLTKTNPIISCEYPPLILHSQTPSK
jgi:hypothetical protein